VVGLTITFAQAHRRQLEREAAGHQHPALDRLCAFAQMGMAGRQSLQVLTIAMHGRSSTSSRRRPICCARWRCANARMSRRQTSVGCAGR
jgi:hypothetical protein